jgi:hypothetical protein
MQQQLLQIDPCSMGWACNDPEAKPRKHLEFIKCERKNEKKKIKIIMIGNAKIKDTFKLSRGYSNFLSTTTD